MKDTRKMGGWADESAVVSGTCLDAVGVYSLECYEKRLLKEVNVE